MTTQCPICRSSVDIDDAKAVDGAKTQCPLCDEVFLVRPLAGSGSSPSSASSGATSGRTTTPSAGHASRKLLEEDVEGASPRVLVAHDSHAFGEVVRGLLEEEGFDVEVVHDGEEAMKVIVDRPPLIAILEAGLPKKFGFQLCAEVRALPDPPAVRFLLVASIYDRKRFAKQPELVNAPDDFVEPRNLELELLPKVRRLLRGRSDATASRSAVGAAAARRVADAPPSPANDPPVAPAVARPEASSFSRRPDPPSVSRPAMSEDDFKDLFEDSESSASVAKSPAESETPVVVQDVDDLLRTGSGRAVDLSAADDEEDVLASMLEDSESEKPEPTTEDPPEEKSSRESDDDELLRTLMQMASSEGLEPSKPTLEDDEVLPDGSEEAKSPARVETDEDSLLGGILEDDEGLPVQPRDEPRDEPTGRAPSDGPMELPSIGASVPAAWKQDAEDAKLAKLASETDADELEKLLRGESASIPAAPRREPTPAKPAPKAAEPAPSAGDDVIRMSEFEMDAPPPKRVEAPPPKSNGSNGGGFELDGDDELKAALEGGMESRAPAGVMPASGSASTPTVLKGPGGAATPAAPTGGNSFSSTESISGDEDDEKSLAEAKVPMDDELDRLLGGSQASSPRAPENMATKPGLGPRPLPADDIATGRPAVAAANGASSEHEKARRLAKLIVGDILLYNADRIPDAVKSNTFFEVMKGDIKDGRDFYDEKVPEGIRRERDHIQEVLEEVLQSKRKELGLA